MKAEEKKPDAQEKQIIFDRLSDAVKLNLIGELGKAKVLHEIEHMIVYHDCAYFQSLNTKSLTLKFFDAEMQAVNHCLDVTLCKN